MLKRVLVTGGAGFIGSAVVRHLIAVDPHQVLVFDKLTYAGNLDNLVSVDGNPSYRFAREDICDRRIVGTLFEEFAPDLVLNLAAESHVDRSIDDPGEFIQTNIVGTFNLLEASVEYWRTLDAARQKTFRFVHISTDEVFGSLGASGLFTEATAYHPNSPYAASKASSDHLVRAWHHTYGLPTIISNCSNNYGPFQFPEKLIPLTIRKIMEAQPIPVYGSGINVRDWLYVDDHVRALMAIAERGAPGESYNVGGCCEVTNLNVVTEICHLMNQLAPSSSIPDCRTLISFVTDRPGHDLRYAIDAAKIQRELGWAPSETFESGLRKTVRWYLDNQMWCERILQRSYRGERLGVTP